MSTNFEDTFCVEHSHSYLRFCVKAGCALQLKNNGIRLDSFPSSSLDQGALNMEMTNLNLAM